MGSSAGGGDETDKRLSIQEESGRILTPRPKCDIVPAMDNPRHKNAHEQLRRAIQIAYGSGAISQAELATLLGVSERTIARWRTGGPISLPAPAAAILAAEVDAASENRQKKTKAS